MAELTPVPEGTRLGDLPALFACLPRLFEAEAGAFAQDLALARAATQESPVRDPWR